MGEYSKAEVDGNLMVITINRPDVYNALHPMASEELSGHFDEFVSNPDLWVAIITGAGDKAFCAGNDLKYHSDLVKKTGKRPMHPAVTGFGGIAARTATQPVSLSGETVGVRIDGRHSRTASRFS